jgi:hypothetical protein
MVFYSFFNNSTMMLRSLSYITPDETERIERALIEDLPSEAKCSYTSEYFRHGNPIIVHHCLGHSNLSTLGPNGRLDETVLNAYLSFLTTRDEYLCHQEWLFHRHAPDPPKFKRSNVVFSSFFLTRLQDQRDNDVSGWKYMKGHMFSGSSKLGEWALPVALCLYTTNRPCFHTYIYTEVGNTCLFDTDKIFFPHHIARGGAADHWALVVVYVKEKRVQYYCSLGGSGLSVMGAVFGYLQKHHLAVRCCVLPDISNWKIVECSIETPRQHNGYDCGIFTCMFADRLMQSRHNTLFTQAHMNCYRRLMLLCLVDKSVPIWTDTDGSNEYQLIEVLDSST